MGRAIGTGVGDTDVGLGVGKIVGGAETGGEDVDPVEFPDREGWADG